MNYTAPIAYGWYTRRENGYYKTRKKVAIYAESETRFKIYYAGSEIWVSKRNVESVVRDNGLMADGSVRPR